MPPTSEVTLAGYVRDLLYECDGREIRGMRLFAPGALVYLSPQLSGDGGERVYVTGPLRDVGAFASIRAPVSRVHRRHRRIVTDPAACRAIAGAGRAWRDEDLANFPDDPAGLADPPGWAPGEWDGLTAGLLSPARPALAENFARVLDVPVDEARTMLDRGQAGAVLRDAALGRWRGGPNPLRCAREAWEALAPVAWMGAADRCFLASTGDGNRELDAPESPLAAACLCADVGGVLAAEEVARELAALACLFALVRLGYAVERVAPGRVELLCPLIPMGRPARGAARRE